MAYYSKLNTSADNFSAMMNAFGVVTVMNAKVFELPQEGTFKFSEKTTACSFSKSLCGGKALLCSAYMRHIFL